MHELAVEFLHLEEVVRALDPPFRDGSQVLGLLLIRQEDFS